jgi:hypothetical protein
VRVRKSVKALRETFAPGVLDSLSVDGFRISYRLRLFCPLPNLNNPVSAGLFPLNSICLGRS